MQKKKKKKKKKKKRNTRKLSYRSSEGRSWSHHFRKCENYKGKPPITIRNVNIIVVISTETSEEIH